MAVHQTHRELVPIELAPSLGIAIRERLTTVAAALALLVLISSYLATQINSMMPVVVAWIMPVGVCSGIVLGRKPQRAVMTTGHVMINRVAGQKTVALPDITKVVLVAKFRHPTAGVQQRLVVVGPQAKPAMTFTTGFWPRLSVDLLGNKLRAAGVPVEVVAEEQHPGRLRRTHPEAVTWWDRAWPRVVIALVVLSVASQAVVSQLLQ